MDLQTNEGRTFEHEGFWLRRRADSPNWHIYWCAPGTRRVLRKSTGTDDFEAAKRLLLRHARERRAGRPPAPASASLRDLLDEYVERILERSPVAWPAEKTARRNWFDFLTQEGVTSVADLTLDTQDRYVAWRLACIRQMGKRGSTGTIHRELGVMKAALRSAWKRGQLESVPYVRSAPLPPPRDRTLTAEECRRLLAACQEPHLWRFVFLSLHTLQRPSAILDLRVEQIDLDRRRIDFLPPGRTQTHKRRPIVPINDVMHTELVRAIRESNRGWVIEYGGMPVKSVKISFRTAARRAGLRDVFPYALRHTGATLLAAEGVPLRQIAGMLGHSEQKTTELYAKHRPEYLKQASDTLVSLFGDGGDRPGLGNGVEAGQGRAGTVVSFRRSVAA